MFCFGHLCHTQLFAFGLPPASAQEQKPRDEQRLDDHRSQEAKDVPLIQLPEGWLSELDHSTGWKSLLADPPTLNFSPVNNHDRGRSFLGNLCGPFTVKNPL